MMRSLFNLKSKVQKLEGDTHKLQSEVHFVLRIFCSTLGWLHFGLSASSPGKRASTKDAGRFPTGGWE